MRDFMTSMVRFSAAMSLFSLQQMQAAMASAGTDSEATITKMSAALDSVTNALSSQMDEIRKPALDSVTKLGSDLVERTWSGLNMAAMDPREMMTTGGEMMRKTADSMTDMMRRATETAAAATAATEPAAVSEALGAK